MRNLVVALVSINKATNSTLFRSFLFACRSYPCRQKEERVSLHTGSAGDVLSCLPLP